MRHNENIRMTGVLESVLSSFFRFRYTMRIGELANKTGHSVETIRYYEKVGLLPAPQRLSNNYRVYGELHVMRLDFIRRCRTLNIGLDEIRLLLESIAEGSEKGANRAHLLIHQHLETVERQMRELRHLKKSLSELASACCGRHDEKHPCGLLEKLIDPETEYHPCDCEHCHDK